MTTLDADAHYRLGKAAETTAAAEAVAHYSVAAQAGHVLSMVALGRMRTDPAHADLSGLPWPAGDVLAAWLEDAARRGHARARVYLGRMHRHGIGLPKDPALARAHFEGAMPYKIAEAAYELAQMAEAGEGMPRDGEKALAWYRESGPLGNFRMGLARAREAIGLRDAFFQEAMDDALALMAAASPSPERPAQRDCLAALHLIRWAYSAETPVTLTEGLDFLNQLAAGDREGGATHWAALVDRLLRWAAETPDPGWRCVGRLLECGMPAADLSYADAYRRGGEAGDRYAAALLALCSSDSRETPTEPDAARPPGLAALTGLTIRLTPDSPHRPTAERVRLHFDGADVLAALCRDRSEVFGGDAFGADLRAALVMACEGLSHPLGEGELQDHHLIALVREIPLRGYECPQCGQMRDARVAPPIWGRVGNGTPTLACPEGHRLAESGPVIIDPRLDDE